MWNGSPTPLSPGPLLPLLSIFPPQANPTDEAVGLSPSPTCSVVAVQPASNANTDACRVASVHAEANERQISSPCQKTRSNAKRKVKDREPPTERRSLTDMYSKRSSSLLRKGEELSHFTHAYVLVFAARPETIGEGNHRLFVSDEFKNADPDLIARINKVTQELNDIALELAHRAGWEVQGRKKRRTDDSNRPAKSQEQARPSHSTSASCSTSRGPATQNQTPNQLPKHITTSNAGRSNSTLVPPKENAAITLPPTSKPFGMEQSKITNVVRALIKLPPNEDNLDLLHEFAQSEVGVRAIDNAKAIPILVTILDMDSLPLACRSALILTSMMHHWMACVAILCAGAAVPLVRLLSRDIGDDIMKSVARAFGRCLPHCPYQFQYSNHNIPADTLSELSTLVGAGNMEIRLAAAQVIHGLGSASCWGFIRYHESGHEESIARGLGRLVLDCRDLSEKERVVSAIAELCTPLFATELEEIIISQIPPLLVHLLGNASTKTAIAACRILRKILVLKDTREYNDVILRHLTPLLSHPDDEAFVEAARTTSVLAVQEGWKASLLQSFPLATIQRLGRLLHHHKEHVVVCALQCIADSHGWDYVLVNFLLEMADEGVCAIVSLMESSNSNVAEAALLVVRRCPLIWDQCMRNLAHQRFLKHGVIQVLLRILACEPFCGRVFEQAVYAIATFKRTMERSLVASTVLHLVHLLLSLENLAKMVVISVVNGLVSNNDNSTHLDPSIPSLLLRLAWDGINSLGLLKSYMGLICEFIMEYHELREAFWEAGAESFLADPQLQARIAELDDDSYVISLRKRLKDSLALLREGR